jgi:membrane protein implicated in regulation of membrane protease activity
MQWPDFFLLCFGLGSVWSLATLLLGGLHLGHGHGAHLHHGGHGHGGHVNSSGHAHSSQLGSWLGSMANPSSMAVFLAWFGGLGYLLTRHTGLLFWMDLTIAIGFGFAGAWMLAAFLRFLQAREKPLIAADYEMVGVLGRVSSTIRPDSVGELIYVRDGARRPVCARSEDSSLIQRGEEVVVTRFEKGVAYVRTWEAMLNQSSVPILKEKENVE